MGAKLGIKWLLIISKIFAVLFPPIGSGRLLGEHCNLNELTRVTPREHERFHEGWPDKDSSQNIAKASRHPLLNDEFNHG